MNKNTIDSDWLRNVTFVAPILRGALAETTENELDPFLQPVLVHTPVESDEEITKKGILHLDGIRPESPPETIRERIQNRIKSYTNDYGTAPGSVFIPSLETIFDVHKVTPSETLPMENRIAVVTGAAGAIGAGICKGLLQKGCRVAATDFNRDNLNSLVSELSMTYGDRVIGVMLDVTDEESVRNGFNRVILQWGGVDTVVVNAGIAMVAKLVDIELDAFRRIEKVNVEGTLLTIAEAGRVFDRQNIGGDIILISTKNVFAPGASFGGYSSTKAAAHQLARIASLELAPLGVRVNMVSPDAVFSEGERRSGLWAEVGPSRMKARGLDEAGLEEYYRSRNLLKTRVTAKHVANAVLFFATRQTPTTGATLPVDGGLPDSAPR